MWQVFTALRYSSGTLICNEGEKSVVACTDNNIAAFTFRTYTEAEILYALDYVNCNGVIVIADNDVVGIKKAELVQECCWRKSIVANVIDIKELWELAEISEECIKGADIYDLLIIKPDVDLENLINKCIKKIIIHISNK